MPWVAFVNCGENIIPNKSKYKTTNSLNILSSSSKITIV